MKTITLYIILLASICLNLPALAQNNTNQPNHDVKINAIELPRFTPQNQDNIIKLTLENIGESIVQSVDVSWFDGINHATRITTHILPGHIRTITHPISLKFNTVEEKDIEVMVTHVNGSADLTPLNNKINQKISSVSQSAVKKVLVEEGTGTWCGACPAGIVGMDQMYYTYGNEQFIGVAIHDGDPMEDSEYAAGAGFGSFPNSNADRAVSYIYPTFDNLETVYNQRKNLTVPASVELVSSGSGSQLNLTVSATFNATISNANYRLGVILTEDNVTGTTSDYDQANYYSGDSQPMGGFENLPHPVPADQMVYDHVGRAVLGTYDGQSNSVPTSITNGQQVSYNFSYTIPSDYDRSNMHAIAVLIDHSDNKKVVNAESISISETLSNGDFVEQTEFNIFPNPVSNFINIEFNSTDNYSATITNMLGKIIMTKDFDTNSQFKSWDISNLSSGQYILSINHNGQSFNKMIIKK